MCRNGREYSVVLQMAEVFVIHMALKVHPQGLRESVSLARARLHVYVRTLLCVQVCVSCAESAVLRMPLMLAADRPPTFK